MSGLHVVCSLFIAMNEGLVAIVSNNSDIIICYCLVIHISYPINEAIVVLITVWLEKRVVHVL